MEKQPDKNKPLKKLPDYKAPDAVWEKIQNVLDTPEEIIPLKEAVSKLPLYEAPAGLWTMLENKIQPSVYPSAPLRKIINKPWIQVAAIMVLLVGILAWFIKRPNPTGPDIEMVQYEEVIREDWQLPEDNDQAVFALVDQFCKEKNFVCNQPEFQYLKSELDELNLACDAMKEVIGNYNDAPEMIAQLTEIEMERTEVLKKILTYL